MSNPINRRRKKLSKDADKVLYLMCYKIAEQCWPLIQRREPQVIKIFDKLCVKEGVDITFILGLGLEGMAEMLLKAAKEGTLTFEGEMTTDGLKYRIAKPTRFRV